jgi:ADP-ribosyl-[dinitrogen reductase] hydrolase
MERHELSRCEVAGIGNAVLARAMRWFHLPIVGASIPDNVFEARWADVGPVLRLCLGAGGVIVLHVGADWVEPEPLPVVSLLSSASPRIARLRSARPGAIETTKQEAYVLGIRPVRTIQDDGLHGDP